MHSAIYEGTIRHRRFAERAHVFRHRVALTYLDLDEIHEVVGGLLTQPSPGIVRFRRSDYLGDPVVPLADAVRALLTERLGKAPQGPIRLLTHLRSLGHCFNPVSFYFCYSSEEDEHLEAIIAEVQNTPWGERRAYVLPIDRRNAGARVLCGMSDKVLHVSPFMGMDQRYVWRVRPPSTTLSVHIASLESGVIVFDATLQLRRRPLDHRGLLRITVRYPAATVRVLVLIYLHALVLWLKGVRIKPHPGAQWQ